MTQSGAGHLSGATRRGRPEATTHAEIERVAFALFARDGFEQTTMDSLAAELGISRRTLFRYYRSKNDIPWARFDQTLDEFRMSLAAVPDDVPLLEALRQAIAEFADFGPGAGEHHRERMRLILETPALQAHATLRYRAWRNVVAEFVARRTGEDVADLGPRAAGHVALGVAMAAYEAWLARPESGLLACLDASAAALVGFVSHPAVSTGETTEK